MSRITFKLNPTEKSFTKSYTSSRFLGYMDVIKDSSSNTAKGNASMVDSSLTECKYDRDNNCDGPGSSSSKENEESYPPSAEKKVDPRRSMGNLSAVKANMLYTTRYFIIKSLNHQNIQLSIEKGIWATQVMNEPILEEAFNNTGRVILIFSVNMSGFFQGYAQMISSIGWRRENVWSEASGGTIPWGRTFKVKWLQLHNLPFQRTLHLKNPLNDYKPVKISRDCQELTQDIGEALCRLIDESIDLDEGLIRNNFCVDEVLLKRPNIKSPVCSPNERYIHNVPPLRMEWAGPPMVHPSVLYQVTQAESSNFHIAHGRSPRRSVPANLVDSFEASKVLKMRHSRIHGSPTDVQHNLDTFSRLNNRNLSSKKGPFADSLSEDDFLKMTYEEYLQVLGRRNKPPAAGPSWGIQEPSTNRETIDHRYSRYLDDLYNSEKKNYHPSPK